MDYDSLITCRSLLHVFRKRLRRLRTLADNVHNARVYQRAEHKLVHMYDISERIVRRSPHGVVTFALTH
jgi:RNase P subunit RPR2